MKLKFRKSQLSQKRGACSLVFDDGYKETIENVLPILDQYNLKATFAFAGKPEMIEQTEQISCSNLDILAKIRKKRHEVASHTLHHKNLTQCSKQELKKELKKSQKLLCAQTIIYPGGKYNKKVIAEASKYYLAGRGVEQGLNNIPPQNFYTLKSFVLRQNTKWFLLNREAKKAHQKNQWLIESYHLVSNRQKNYRFTVTPEEFENHLKKLIALNLWIAPLGKITNYILKHTVTKTDDRSFL